GAHHVRISLADQLDPQPVVPLRRLVAEQRDPVVDLADDQVGAAVVVQVADDQATRLVRRPEIATAPRTDVGELHRLTVLAGALVALARQGPGGSANLARPPAAPDAVEEVACTHLLDRHSGKQLSAACFALPPRRR